MSLLQVLNFHGKTGDTMADKNYLHTAYSNSADGTNGFTTVYPNLNLLDGTKDFSGYWKFSQYWTNDGTYKGLTVKKKTKQWNGITKIFTVPKDGIYTFSAYVKSSGNTADINRFGGVNTLQTQPVLQRIMGNNFDWTRDIVTLNLKANDTVYIRYEIAGSGTDSILWTAGHKWEEGSIATPWMPSSSEVTSKDYPTYIGTYTDENEISSTNPSDYTWERMNYRIYLDGIAVAGSKLLSTKVENLKPDTSYTIQVKQVSGEEESDFSDSVTFKTNVQK